MPKAVRQVAILAPASSAVVPKATPIWPASRAKPLSSSRAILAWPAAAMIWATPSAGRPSADDSCRTSRFIWSNCCGVSKSTTFFTSSMASWKFTAALPTATRGAAAATPAPMAEAPAPAADPAKA
ncbi:hypothetical protein D3C77_358830 [compost metagenome]